MALFPHVVHSVFNLVIGFSVSIFSVFFNSKCRSTTKQYFWKVVDWKKANELYTQAIA